MILKPTTTIQFLGIKDQEIIDSAVIKRAEKLSWGRWKNTIFSGIFQNLNYPVSNQSHVVS